MNGVFYTDVNECDAYTPCRNNATCINNNGSYVCNCTEGWQGHDCKDGNDKHNNVFIRRIPAVRRRINKGKGVRSYSNEYSNDHFRC